MHCFSLGRKRNTGACRACALRRTGGGRFTPHGRALHEREAAALRWKAVIPRAKRGAHFVSLLARVARLRVTSLAVSGEEAQYRRLPARAQRCVGCCLLTPSGRALHEQEASLLRCKTVRPRAGQSVHFMSRFVYVAHFCATALPLFEEEAQYGRSPRTRAAPRRLWSLRAL